MKSVEHIGIAVEDLDEAEKRFEALLGVSSYKREVVESEGVITSFFRVGDVKIELLSSLDRQSAIAKFLEKRGEGIHHIAFGVKNSAQSLKEKVEAGFIPISAEPKAGADNKEIAFLHPKSTHGVLVELCSDQQ